MLCMFQVFCSHLEQLIQWLCTVSEKMELLAAPTVDIDSVRSSLAEYQVKPCITTGWMQTHTVLYLLFCVWYKRYKKKKEKNVIQIWAPLVCYPDWMKCNLGTYLYSSLLLERLEALCFQVICLILQISHKCPLGLINSQNMFLAITQKWKCIW